MAIFKLSGESDSTFPCIPNGIFEIEAGYPTFKGGQDGQEGVIKGWINYDEYEDFIAQMQPPSTFVGGNMVVSYGAEMPGFPYLRVTDWEAERYPKEAPESDLDANNYRKHPLMYVTLYFRFVKQRGTSSTNPSYNPDPAPYLIHRWSAGGQVLSLDNKGLMWDDIRRRNDSGDAQPFFVGTHAGTSTAEHITSKRQRVGVSAAQDQKVNAVLQIPHIEHEITWPRVPVPPFTYIKRFVGCVNDREMKFRTGTIPAECLLFTGAKVQETVMSNGETSWELVYTFAERQVTARDQQGPGGWNHFFRSKEPDQIFFSKSEEADDYFCDATYWDGNGSYGVDGSLGCYFGCTGLPGFYRLELSPGNPSNPCIPSIPVVAGGTETIDQALKTGYLEDLAIFKKRDLGLLFKPEPSTTSP